MVFQNNRLDYGFNGYQVPPTPRAARSVRRRCMIRRKADDDQMCAFDLLATVAGKLLLEGGSSSESVNTFSGKGQPEVVEGEGEKHENNKLLGEKPHGRDNYERNFLFTEIISEPPPDINLCPQSDACSRPASDITMSDCSEKAIISPEQLRINDECKLQLGIFPRTADVESLSCRLEHESKKQIKVEEDPANNKSQSISNKVDMSSSEAWDRKSSSLVSSFDSVKFPTSKDQVPSGSLPVNREDVKLVTKDDDENSSRCTKPSSSSPDKALTTTPRVGDCRVRKLVESKYWKVNPTLKNEEHYIDGTERHSYLERKNSSYKCHRSQRDFPIKKRKLYDYSSVSNSDEGISSDGICSKPENTSSRGLHRMPRVTSAPTSAAGEEASFHSRDSHVKLEIKSFRVPELYIEIPESATVGSLKRTVMEAVTTILGGGLRVGVLVQGKKIRDDNKTLFQSGISHDDKLDSLGFTLEPSPTQATLPACPEDHIQLFSDAPRTLSRYIPTPNVMQNMHQPKNLVSLPDRSGTNLNNFIGSDHDSTPSPPDTLLKKAAIDSKALVPVPPMKAEALAVVPLRKLKRSESVQRRIRRPFTVSEVEALVQAVEKLGTGRWRDVKLRAFDTAKHRTYVDLKDKWKTLVHTARISPQQRRGEPVPQELLDRVLTAHAYWTQQQAK